MRIEIDQSLKIENTNKSTVVAYSNKESGSLVILSNEKKTIQRYFRQIGKPRLFAYLSFAALICLLVKEHLRDGYQIIIDREYPGFERLIKRKLTEFINENTKIKDFTISTSQVGKKSRAHIIAYSILKKRSKLKVKKVYAQDVISIIRRNLKSGST